MKIRYIGTGLGALAAALCLRYYFVVTESARIRVEAFEFQQLAESIQPQLATKRQQLQVQQEKLNKGSAISQTVGPAVLGDIRSAAEKSNNVKLKELLVKYGVRETPAAAPVGAGKSATSGGSGVKGGGASEAAPAGTGEAVAPSASKKGGN